jgi:CRP-like cAMP-binding protein
MECNHCIEQRNCIKRVPIFSSLNPDEMTEVARITTPKAHEKGDMIYMAGDQGGKMFVLHTGKVKIFRLTASGKEQVIRVVGPGEFFGELSLFSRLPLTDYAQAIEPSKMCVVEGVKLKELMTKYTSIAFKVMEELSKRLEAAEAQIEAISANTVEKRIAKALLSLSEGKHEVHLPMSKGDFASSLGMSQETLSRKLTQFADQGLIKLSGSRRILLLDRERLKEI